MKMSTFFPPSILSEAYSSSRDGPQRHHPKYTQRYLHQGLLLFVYNNQNIPKEYIVKLSLITLSIVKTSKIILRNIFINVKRHLLYNDLKSSIQNYIYIYIYVIWSQYNLDNRLRG